MGETGTPAEAFVLWRWSRRALVKLFCSVRKGHPKHSFQLGLCHPFLDIVIRAFRRADRRSARSRYREHRGSSGSAGRRDMIVQVVSRQKLRPHLRCDGVPPSHCWPMPLSFSIVKSSGNTVDHITIFPFLVIMTKNRESTIAECK